MVQKSSMFSNESEFTEISGARTLPRALRVQKILAFEQKIIKNAIFVIFVVRSARVSARAPNFFSDLNSPNPGDEFCTLNESKIVKIDN